MIGNRSKIQRLKDISLLDMHGVNIAMVLAVYLYETGFYRLTRRLIYSFFWLPVLKGKSESLASCDAAVVHGCKWKKRKDYDDLIDRFIHNCAEPTHSYEVIEKFSWINPFLVMLGLPSVFRSLYVGRKVSLCKALYMGVLYSRMRNLEHDFISLVSCYRKIVTFCDAHPYDNMLTQLAKISSVSTYTMQHGQYRRMDDEKNPDSEAISNFISDKMLCWGEKTICEYEKSGYGRERFKIVGSMDVRSLEEKKHLDGVPRRAFGVLFCGENTRDINYQLLRVVKEISSLLGVPYVIRLHPDNKEKDYLGYASKDRFSNKKLSFNEFLDGVDFCVSHATGAFMLVLGSGRPCFVYKDSSLPEVFDDERITFTDAQALICKYKNGIDPTELLHEYMAPSALPIYLD